MKIIFLGLFFLSTLAQAGNLRGNGGKGLVCPNKPVRFFDIIRGEDDWGVTQESPSGATYLEMAEFYIDRLAALDPNRVPLMKAYLATFVKESRFYTDYTLFMLNDSDEVGLPLNCKLELIINQQAPQFPKEARYRINKNLWNELKEEEKAALVLHEILIREKLEHYGYHQDTFQKNEVSYFVANIVSTELPTLSLADYQQLGISTNTRFSYGPYFWLNDSNSYPSGELFSVFIYNYQPVNLSPAHTSVKLPKDSANWLLYFPSGELLGVMSNSMEIEAEVPTLSGVKKLWVSPYFMMNSTFVYFYPNGRVSIGEFHNGTSEVLKLKKTSGETYELKPNASFFGVLSDTGEVMKIFNFNNRNDLFCTDSKSAISYPVDPDADWICVNSFYKRVLNIDLPRSL